MVRDQLGWELVESKRNVSYAMFCQLALFSDVFWCTLTDWFSFPVGDGILSPSWCEPDDDSDILHLFAGAFKFAILLSA